MNPFNNILIAFFASGMAGIIFIVYILSKQHNKVNQLMKLNRNVTPLLLYKSTQHKFETIHSMLATVPSVHRESIHSNLIELAANFRNQSICVKTYNRGLDNLMQQLNQND